MTFLAWPEDVKEPFESSFQGWSRNTGVDEKTFLVNTALDEIRKIKFMLDSETEESVRWSSLPLKYGLELTDASCDDLIFCWTELRNIDHFLRPQYADSYKQLLSRLLPTVKRPAEQLGIHEISFYRNEKHTADGRCPSLVIWQKVKEYYSAYAKDSEGYLAPYTSVVGPSGIGKSFAISKLANHGFYVSYASLAPEGSLAYPGRSQIANNLPRYENRESQVHFWESYITVALSDIEVCRSVEISPLAFYKLQSMEIYRKYQTEFSIRVGALFDKYNDNTSKNSEGLRSAGMRDFLAQQNQKCVQSMTDWKRILHQNEHESPDFVTVTSMRGEPKGLICIDEARALLDSTNSMLFRSFREAARNRFQATKKGSSSMSMVPGDFFALVLDTTSRVANFSPPARHDRSQKVNRLFDDTPRKLFPPIYAIDTLDVFANNKEDQVQDGSGDAVSSLFRLGRPLWGGRIESGQDLTGISELAMQKISGQGAVYWLALLSYRINYYVASNVLAEELVSGWLRYILYINKTRDMLRTIQPTEPILADSASRMMLDPSTRLSVIQQFVTSSFEGTVNIGDLGELVVAMLLLFAFDEARYQVGGNWPAAVALPDFIGMLLGKEMRSKIKACVTSDQEMDKIWTKGTIFCNHFVRLQYPPDEETLQAGFNRGVGFFTPEKFTGADLLIPIKIAGSRMTFFAFQVKNRKRDKLSNHLRNELGGELKEAATEIGLNRPYIGMAMALRQEKSSVGEGQVEILQPKIAAHVTRSSTSAIGNYKWPAKTQEKALMLLGVGLDDKIYPAATLCRGERTEETRRILPLLHRLLDCKAGTSLPDDADKVYAGRLMMPLKRA